MRLGLSCQSSLWWCKSPSDAVTDRPAPLRLFPSCFSHPRPREGAEQDFFLRARWVRPGLTWPEEVGTAVMPSWPRSRVYGERKAHPNVSVESPHRRPMIVSSSGRLLRKVYVGLSWGRIPVFEVCERMLLGVDVTSLHPGCLPDAGSEGYPLFEAFEMLSLRMGIPTSESPTRVAVGDTTLAHAHVHTHRPERAPAIVSYPHIPIQHAQYTLIRRITDQPAAQTGPGISRSAMATNNDVKLKPNPTTPPRSYRSPIPDFSL